MNVQRRKLTVDGSVQLPPDLLASAHLKPGDDVELLVEDGRLVVRPPSEQTLKRIQAEVRTYVPAGTSLVDQLISERRAEAARE